MPQALYKNNLVPSNDIKVSPNWKIACVQIIMMHKNYRFDVQLTRQSNYIKIKLSLTIVNYKIGNSRLWDFF